LIKKKELSGKKELSVVLSEVRSKREKLSVAGSGKPATVHVLHFLVQHFLLLLSALSYALLLVTWFHYFMAKSKKKKHRRCGLPSEIMISARHTLLRQMPSGP